MAGPDLKAISNLEKILEKIFLQFRGMGCSSYMAKIQGINGKVSPKGMRGMDTKPTDGFCIHSYNFQGLCPQNDWVNCPRMKEAMGQLTRKRKGQKYPRKDQR
jgi:hypothetical protein